MSSVQSMQSRRTILTWYLACWLLCSAWLMTGCGHPAERALQGRWLGVGVENFESDEIAAATGWARGTSLEISGRRLKITVPAQKSRVGVYELSAIEDRTVTLSVLNSQGENSELELIVDDAENLRWLLGDGRTLVLKKDTH